MKVKEQPNGFYNQHFASGWNPHRGTLNLDGLEGQMSNQQLNALVSNLDEMCQYYSQSRFDFFSQFFDRGHKIQEECGYPNIQELLPEYWRELYDMDPVANRVCQLMPKESWQSTPLIYEEERGDKATPFEQAWDEMCNSLSPQARSWHKEEQGSSVWEHLLRADILSGIGQFGVILLGLDDGKNMQDPADGVEVIANSRIAGVTCTEYFADSPPHGDEVNAALEEVSICTNSYTGKHWETVEARRLPKSPLPEQKHVTWNNQPGPDGQPSPEACVLTNAGWMIVDRATGAALDVPWNRKQVLNYKVNRVLVENAARAKDPKEDEEDEEGEWATEEEIDDLPEDEDENAENAFCPTGKGGGVDASCSPSGDTAKRAEDFTYKRVEDIKGRISDCPPECIGELPHHIGIDRKDMPQIARKDRKEFFEYAKAHGIKIEKGEAKPKELLPTQHEFDQRRVDRLKGEVWEHKKTKPLIISSDNRVLDGTHHWVKHLQSGSKSVPIVRLGLPAKDAVKLMNRFPKTTHAAVDAPPTGNFDFGIFNKVTKEIDPYLGRTTTPRQAGSAGYPGSDAFVQGTDSMYGPQFGMGMPAPIGEIDGGPALSGTDQQYFGVQFGPSEAFADKPSKAKRRLLFLRCFDESLVQVVRYEWNIRNPRFGLPVMYRITLNDPRQPHSGVGLPLATVYVHWSRVIHVADNLHASEIFGVPRMRPCLYPILDARKVRAASAEGYWQACLSLLSLETHPQLGGDAIVDVPSMQSIAHNLKERLQRLITTSGMSLKSVSPEIKDPTPFVAVLIEAICICLGCPIRVFKGTERGELASSQDDEDWNERRRSRQHLYLTPMLICPFIDRLIQIGVLPEPGKGRHVTSNVLVSHPFQPGVAQSVTRSGMTWSRPLVCKKVKIRTSGGKVKVLNVYEPAEDEAGYIVEWPDIDAIGKKDKAGIALQNVQTISQFVNGNCESVLPAAAFWTRIMGWSEEDAEAIQDELEAQQEEQQQEAEDLADEHGFKPEPPEGWQNDPAEQQPDEDE